MPLHLLGKKSWNVYNTANIARVRADEEAARAREEAEEQKQQEQDAERRLAILRGEEPPPLPPPTEPTSPGRYRNDDDREPWHIGGGEKRKRKRAGEDDTDFEMRLARSRAEEGSASTSEAAAAADTAPSSLVVKHKSSDAPLIDAAGHIDLFAPPPADTQKKTEKSRSKIEKNPEAEAEAARKQRSFEDQYTMRFSNAAGFRTELSKTASGPWYATASTNDDKQGPSAPVVGTDVWGNDDPRRHEREAARIVSSDPLAMMKRGAAQVRQVEHERRTANAEREKASRQLRREEEQRRRERKRRHRQHREEGGGSEARSDTARTESHRSDHRHSKHRHRDADPERSRDRQSRRGHDDGMERSSSRRHRHESGEDEGRRHHKSSHHDEERQRRSDDERFEKRQHRESRR